MRVTDGPNGARGSSVLGAGEATAVCIPCGSALGATWNLELIERLGALLGEESLTKGCRILLAPTLNLHRSPLAGRNFECFSEDPLLAGRAAAAYVRGVQSRDVATTPKHLVGNEAELDRYTMSSEIDERALRELYLVPFELAVREGGALGLMTAYNRLNGGYCTEDEALLAGILRGEWGFDGFVVSDWFALGSTTGSPRAGLDLEMPGPGRIYGPALADAVARGDVDEALARRPGPPAARVLDRVGALDDDPDAPERSEDRPEHRALAREAAAAASCCCATRGMLPLDAGALALAGRARARTPTARRSWAAARPSCARTTPSRRSRRCASALAGRRDRATSAAATSTAPAPELRAAWRVEFAGLRSRSPSATPACCCSTRRRTASRPLHRRARAHAGARPARTRSRSARPARARLLVDGEVVLDGFEDPPPRGEAMIGLVSEEISARGAADGGRAGRAGRRGHGRGRLRHAPGRRDRLRPPAPAT